MNDAAPQTPRNPMVLFKHDLNRIHEAGELALPDTVPFKNFRNAAIVAITDNPSILQCKRETIFKAIRTLAAAGLVPDGREAAIVPFKGSAQAMPMVQGLIKIARNTGKITSLWADVVYEGETLDVWVEGGERKWDHVKADGSRIDAMSRGGAVIGAYAVAKLTDGTIEFRPMTRAEIEKRRNASANQKGDRPTGIWEKWYDEMALKTVIRNLCKRLPMSSDDIERLMKEQDQPTFRDITPSEGSVSPNLAQRLSSQSALEPHKEVLGTETPEPPVTDSHDAPVEDAEVLPELAVDPFNDEYTEGVKASQAGMKETHNPHKDGSQDWTDWNGGWVFAEDQKK